MFMLGIKYSNKSFTYIFDSLPVFILLFNLVIIAVIARMYQKKAKKLKDLTRLYQQHDLEGHSKSYCFYSSRKLFSIIKNNV